ncbi:MAG: hypothetical protein AB7E55_18495 [Pigmentiphaga sp.]
MATSPADALRYGAGTPGGVINFVTPTRHDADRLQGRVASANITDQAHAGSVLFEPGTGRALFAGVQFRH